MPISRTRLSRIFVPESIDFLRLEPRQLLDGGAAATPYLSGIPSSSPPSDNTGTSSSGTSVADDTADIDKDLKAYNDALLNYKIDRLTYLVGLTGWKVDKTDFNVRVIELKTDLKAFKDQYKPLKLKLYAENTVKPDGKVEPALKLEIDITGILNSFNDTGKKELAELQKRFDGLQGELQGLNANKDVLDDSAASLKKRDSDLQSWYMRIQKKIKDVNYKIGMTGGQGGISVALEWPPDAPGALAELALDEDALNA